MPTHTPIGATCPAIDDLKRFVRLLAKAEEPATTRSLKTQALAAAEQLREANTQLRHNAATWEAEARAARAQLKRLGVDPDYPLTTREPR